MKLTKMHKQIIVGVVALLLVGGGVYAFTRKPEAEIVAPPSKKPKKAVNLIPLEERPYVTIQPLQARNMLEVTIHDLKKKAKSVEVTLEYDRNKGVLDAVLNSFSLDKTPLIEQMFLGSKSAGGATTYHDDVIGGSVTLDFSDEDYALEVPWRYDDTKTSYDALSTTDGKFQIKFDKPLKTAKVLVMQSPGLPTEAKGKVLSGPYFVGIVGDLPDSTAEVKLRLSEESNSATIYGLVDGKWVAYETVSDGKTATAKGALVSTYIATN
jgi:hypothetical protein